MTVLYFSQSKLDYSVNAVYIRGLYQNGVTVKTCQLPNGFRGFYEAVKYCRLNLKDADLIMVGYDSPGIAVLMKMIFGKKVVYNALCSMYERLIVSRKLAAPLSLKALYYWFLDFAAVHLADLTMLETNNQIKYFNELFKVSPKKLFRAWTGVEDEIFYRPDQNTDKFPVFTVVFRGRFLPEAGADVLVKGAKLLDDHELKIYMLGNGPEGVKVERLIKDLRPKNLELISVFLPGNELRTILQKSHLSLGQLADHPRLERTIPHKAYESLALKLPYLTAANMGVLEILVPNETCLICKPGDEKSLAEAILWAKNHPDELNKIAENSFRLYQSQLRPQILANKLLEHVKAKS